MKTEKIIFIDTETTGLPRDWNAPASRIGNWPRIVQLAWMLTDHTGTELASANHIIKPQGYTIPEVAVKIHGITTEMAIQTGIPLSEALQELTAILPKAGMMVAHNVSFDEKVISAEYFRAGKSDVLASVKKVCLMKAATEYCRLPGRYGYKWPTLSELHTTLFKHMPVGLHNADSDMRICARCYFELRNQGIM